jgi:hypothetical protein
MTQKKRQVPVGGGYYWTFKARTTAKQAAQYLANRSKFVGLHVEPFLETDKFTYSRWLLQVAKLYVDMGGERETRR